MTKPRRLNLILLALIGVSGCGRQASDTWPAPDKKQIIAISQKSAKESLIIAITSSGGGAGDITYRLLDCNSGVEKCELLASIDTNDRPAPSLAITQEGIALIVNRSDYLADFRNFSRELGSLQPSELYLQYRTDRGDEAAH
jgi:hypothetical protein